MIGSLLVGLHLVLGPAYRLPNLTCLMAVWNVNFLFVVGNQSSVSGGWLDLAGRPGGALGLLKDAVRHLRRPLPEEARALIKGVATYNENTYAFISI